ncbi:hypothetical protein [Devosia sp.]|uniref:hypothetical protein n=1 Tax=Devosia sp. TaxID=1871048 RepID=UPI003431665B
MESLGAGAPVEPQKGRKGPEPQIADDATLAEAGQTFLTPRLDVPTMQVRFVDALGKSVVTHSDLDKKPLEMTLKHPLPEKVRVYLFNATRPAGGRPLGEHKIQLILPNQPRGERGSLDHSDGRFVILAGYSAEDDVFILWDAGLYRDFAYSRNVQVKAETIVQATGGSIAVQRRTLRPVGGEMVTEEVLAASSADLASAIQRRLELSLERHRG